MYCKYCTGLTVHDIDCPNYNPPIPKYRCVMCKNNIYPGELCVKNSNGEYAHWDCVGYTRYLLDFLHIELEEMDE